MDLEVRKAAILVLSGFITVFLIFLLLQPKDVIADLIDSAIITAIVTVMTVIANYLIFRWS